MGTYVHHDKTQGEDHSYAIIEYEGDRVAMIENSWATRWSQGRQARKGYFRKSTTLIQGGTADDAFHLILPTTPGFGLSSPLLEGWDAARTAGAYHRIMQALGYERYGVSGGDVGAGISAELGLIAGERMIGALVVTATRSMPGSTVSVSDSPSGMDDGTSPPPAGSRYSTRLLISRGKAVCSGRSDSPRSKPMYASRRTPSRRRSAVGSG